MMQTIAQLRERLGTRFDSAEQVDKTILRFVRKANGQAFALYYVDVGSTLPRTSEELAAYQDRVIGASYFDGKKSLQWSNYLYFVISADRAGTMDTQAAKTLIESDRAYARKYVVVENELDAALAPPQMPTSASLPEANILSLWLTRLASAGLDAAVLSDKPLPSRLLQIEATAGVASSVPTAPVPQQRVANLPFLKRIGLTNYRPFPTQRHFDLGAVNLIVGTNGTGKTSLLEAIELLYCGRNKRNADAATTYSLAAEYADGSEETVTQARQPRLFRDRNLQWYGQAEVKTNNLFASFALFNFLDTDAAVRLAESTAGLEEDLSNLLVGAEASKIWREIGRVHEAVIGRLRELRPLEAQIKDELAAIEVRLKDASAVKQESDAIFARLEELLRRLKWPTHPKEKAPSVLLESLLEVTSLTQQAASFKWAGAPVSMSRLTAYASDTQQIVEKAEGELTRLEAQLVTERKATEETKRSDTAGLLIDEVNRIVDAGFPTREAAFRACRDTIAAQTGLVAGCDEAMLTALKNSRQDMGVDAFGEVAASALASAQNEARAAKQEYDGFTRLRQQSVTLAQQLRDIASKLLEGSPKPDECPLCHTEFEPGQLARHMQSGVDQLIESRSQLLLAQMRQCEESVSSALVAATASNWLRAFCARAELDSKVTTGVALAKVGEAIRALAEADQKRVELTKELQAFAAQGISVARINELASGLRDAGHPLSEWNVKAVEQVRAAIVKQRTSVAATLKEERSKVEVLQRSLQQTLGVSDATPDSLKTAISQLKERRTIAASLLSKLAVAMKPFPWPMDGALSELTVEVVAIRSIATELQAAVGREQQAKATLAEATKRSDQLNKQLADLAARIARFVKAEDALSEIKEKYSLTGAMEAALKRNRAGIEKIFGRIHSPAEFAGLGQGLSSLVRKNGATEATLNQISTGQRAAFALSIFLAQNAQLRSAPPVMLIDDPIAHIDDLNALSFLDFLREVALSGNRQILFATASEKLAALFQRKFDFLGDGFRRHDLHR
jgi:DNA repair exonuclease SbcCD ATPase subunit